MTKKKTISTKKTLQLKRRALKRNRRRPRSKGQICKISATLRDSITLKREGYVAGIDEGNKTIQLQRKLKSSIAALDEVFTTLTNSLGCTGLITKES